MLKIIMDIDRLIKYYNKFKYGEELYHKLMLKRVRKILLISTFYNALSLEEETKFSEQIIGGYHQFSLTSIPKVTNAINAKHAIRLLEKEEFDMVISTSRIGEPDPFKLSEIVKKKYPDSVFLLLLTETFELKKINISRFRYIDNVFLWTGNPALFLAMIKSVEDLWNAPFDTKEGGISVILLVEDSINFYSIYLPELYKELMVQTQKLITEESNNDIKYLRMRSRPKILFAKNLEEAKELLEKYKDYLLCVITDLELQGENHAGLELIDIVKNSSPYVPVLAQSSDSELLREAHKKGVEVSHKNTPFILNDFHNFLVNKCGFGDFVFRNGSGDEVYTVKTLAEFEKKLAEIPIEVFEYHKKNKHFCTWLAARGELTLAKKLRKIKTNKFKSSEHHRKFLLNVLKNLRKKEIKGKILNFSENSFDDEYPIYKIGDGSLGGKGRGLSFLNAILAVANIKKKFSGAIIDIPKTFIVCTSFFDQFIEDNYLYLDYDYHNDDEIAGFFKEAKLPKSLNEFLLKILNKITNPIVVRSSGLLEDSQFHPFAGVYKSVMLPNNHEDINVRLEQLSDAVKLVYASVYFKESRAYINRIGLKLEEEKMAVIIQEIVGKENENYFYPDFSGVAQSYNYYPISYITNRDGVAVVGVGLGSFVVEGEKAYRFCPKYPEVKYIEDEDILKLTQSNFFALDISKKDEKCDSEDSFIVKLPINVAKEHGRLFYTASTWDYINQRIEPGISSKGPIIINFENILKYEYLPLAKILTEILELCEAALGAPVEIEFAVNIGEINCFHLLQVRPLTTYDQIEMIDIDSIDKDKIFLLSKSGCGNGVIDEIYYIVYIEPDLFDNTKTNEMKNDISKINEILKSKDNYYLLIGPGRWGSRDKFLGISVDWNDISNAKAIVEVGFKDFDIEPSQGTHFMHNVISMNIGYFNIPYYSNDNSFIDWEWLKSKKVEIKGEFCKVVKLSKPLKIIMDGKKCKYAILKGDF